MRGRSLIDGCYDAYMIYYNWASGLLKSFALDLGTLLGRVRGSNKRTLSCKHKLEARVGYMTESCIQSDLCGLLL